MKKRRISIVAVVVFAVLVAGAAYAHMDRNEWCNGNWGGSPMMGSSSGHMMGPNAEHMGPANGRMSAYAGHMGSPSPDHMAARRDGESRNYDCPASYDGRRDAGGKSETR